MASVSAGVERWLMRLGNLGLGGLLEWVDRTGRFEAGAGFLCYLFRGPKSPRISGNSLHTPSRESQANKKVYKNTINFQIHNLRYASPFHWYILTPR